MLPNTHLMCAPSDADNIFGRTILSSDLIETLRRINPAISVPQPDAFGWYPGKKAGMTCLWLGPPTTGIKISAIHLGAVPEFTQIAPDGTITIMGWRRILARVITARAATKHQLEQAFRVQLDTDGSDGLCRRCVADGIKNKHNGGVLLLCDVHESTWQIASRARAYKRERNYLRRTA